MHVPTHIERENEIVYMNEYSKALYYMKSSAHFGRIRNEREASIREREGEGDEEAFIKSQR